MKKKLTLLLLLIIPFFAYSETVYVDGLKYETDPSTKTASLTGYKGEKPTGELIIPSTITVENVAYAVTSIGDNAFINCIDLIGNITIPNSVKSIGVFAFCDCYNVNKIIVENITPFDLKCNVFPTNKFIYVPIGSLEKYKSAENWSEYTYIKEIGTDVELNITLAAPNTLLAEVIKASSHPTKVNRLTIKGEIGDDDWALLKSNFTMLYYLDLSQTNNSEIPREAFCMNYLLQTIILPNNLLAIGNSAFEFSNLTGNLTIPNTVTSIGDYAFSGCYGFIGNLVIPNSVTSIGKEAFYYCNGFTGNLTIGNSVTSIGELAFCDCSGFTGNLTIGNSVTSIGSSAFEECSGLTGKLTIPNSVTSIGAQAFCGCDGFTGNLTIPNSVTSIGAQAFRGCDGFTGNLTIGNSVTSIGAQAFYGCGEFSKINCNPTTPPSCGDNCFTVDTETCVLAVPTGTLMSYFMAPVWGTFINIVEDSSLAVEDNLVDAAKVVTIGGKLMVSGAEDGVAIKVYDLNGVAVANGVITDGAAQLELPATKGIYIAIVGNQSYKVVR